MTAYVFPEAKLERFRGRSIIALALVCGIAAYAAQVFIGIFIERDLGAALSSLGAYNFVLPALALAAALWLWLLLKPLHEALRSMAAGSSLSKEEREAARAVADKVPALVAAVVLIAFILGPALTMIVNAAVGGASYALVTVLVSMAVNLAFGYAAGLQAIVLIESILRFPVGALGLYDFPPGRKGESLSSRVMLAGSAASSLALVLAIAAGYGALSAAAPPKGGAFLLEMLALAAAIALWTFALFRTVGRTLARRSSDVGDLMRKVAVGEANRSTRVPIIKNDELSAIASAFNIFLDRLTALLASVSELSVSVEDGAAKLSGSADHAREAVSGLGVSVEAVRDAVQRQSDTVSGTEGEIASLLQSIDHVAVKVGEQSGFMDQSSAAVSEMAANIASVSRTAERADEIATALRKASEEGGDALRASISSIAEIDEASRSVRDIIGVISKISAQTNLLAMNAAIEAAHAGEAGRGFAVVADEVRSLAESSAKSAKEIELLIRGMTEKTNRGAGLAASADKAFDRIREGVAQTSELVRTIAASMSEQKEGAEEILQSSQSLADATRLIESLAEGQKAQSKGMEQSMMRIVSASNEIFEAVQEETGATQSLGRIVALVGEEASLNSERVLGLEEAVSKFKSGAS
jgi:methyl-accepting chemotaxis protein